MLWQIERVTSSTPRRLLRTAALTALLGLGGILFALVPDGPARADVHDFTFDSFEADYHLGRDADGNATLRVVETLVADFPSFDQNRGIVRSIPDRYDATPLDLTVVSVTDEGGAEVPYEATDTGSALDLALGTDDYVHGRTTYVIEYTMRNVVREFADTDADEFYWDVNGSEWRQPFGRVEARLHVPAELAPSLTGDAACYQGEQGSDAPCALDTAVLGDETVITAGADDLDAGENVTIAVGFDRDTFVPAPDASRSWIYTTLPFVLMGVQLLLVVAVIVGRTFWRRDARGRGTVIAQYEAPDGVNPTTAASVLRTRPLLPAAVVQLAVNRVARLTEQGGAERQRFALELLDPAAAPTESDDVFRYRVFGSDQVGERTVLDAADRRLGDRLRGWEADGLTSNPGASWWHRPKVALAKRLRLALLVPFAVALVVEFFSVDAGITSLRPFTALLLTFALLVVGLALSGTRRVLTEAGAEVRDHLLGLREYIRLAEADRLRFLQSPDGATRVRLDDRAAVVRLNERLLPYAMLFGMEREWGEVLAKDYTETAVEPDWIEAQERADRLRLLYRLRSDVPQSFATTPTPSASSTSISSGGSFSGGSSGGGFSGGGGGGGGGGGR